MTLTRGARVEIACWGEALPHVANVWTRMGLWERADKQWLVKAGAVFGPIRWEAYFGYGEVTVAVEGGASPIFSLFV